MIKENLFLTHTPYHILMAATVIKQENLKNNTLIIFEDFKFHKEDYTWLNNYFNEIIILKSCYKLNKTINKLNNKFLKFFYVRYFTLLEVINIKILIKNLKKTSWNRIHCFNDLYAKVQVLISKLKNNNTKVAYVEDGSAAYWIKKDIFEGTIVELKKFFSPKRLFLKSFKFMDKYEIINVFGGGSYIDTSYFLYADLICNELKIREVHEIKSNNLKSIILENTTNKFNLNNSIIILAELYSPELKEKYKELFKYLTGYNIYIKYHPRECNFYLNDLLHDNGYILPNNVPLENILINSNNNIIIGTGGSTVFLTLPKISNNNYISLNNLFNINFNSDYENTLRKIGILIPTSYDEFEEFFKYFRKEIK